MRKITFQNLLTWLYRYTYVYMEMAMLAGDPCIDP